MARIGDAQQLLALLDEKRPRFWAWLRLNEIDYRTAASPLGVSHAHLWAVCLPWADKRRVEPDDALKDRITEYTAGVVRRDHWAPPSDQAEAA